MGRLAVLQSDGIRHLLCHTNLFARAVDEFEVTLRKHNSQGNTRKTATSTKVENLRTRTEVNHLGNSQRVKHVVLVEVVDILARNHVDLRVPVTIKGVEGVKLSLLLLAQLWKIFQNNLCCHIIKLLNEFFRRCSMSV